MNASELAKRYLDIFTSGQDIERLRRLFDPEAVFSGPFVELSSAEDYLQSLDVDPPEDCYAEILHLFEDEHLANVIYKYNRGYVPTRAATGRRLVCSRAQVVG